MNKKCIMGALLMMASTTAMAQDYNYLTVGYSDTEESISLPTIQKIFFAEGNCVVETTKGTYTYPLSEMKKMTFTSEETAIKALPEVEKGLEYQKGVLKVAGNGMLRVYNASGALVQMANVKEGANISLGNLPAGLYIVNIGDKTIKLTK